MNALKALVAVLTLLIIVAVSVIAYGMFQKIDDPDFKFFELSGDKQSESVHSSMHTSVPDSVRALTPGIFGEIMISIPTGCNISTITGDGLRIFIKIGPTNLRCERVIVLDSNNGDLLGTIRISG
tara:strand:- start:222 stop:596 length:375 start_codon:yes stop_codon:yes gene_type:complete